MLRFRQDVSVERVGDDWLVLTQDGVVHKLTGTAAQVLECVTGGRPVPDDLKDAVSVLVDAGVLRAPGGMTRRQVLAVGGAAAAVGLTTLVLPMASAAASPAPAPSPFPTSPSSTITVGTGPLLFNPSPDGTKLYLSCYSGGVWEITPATNGVSQLIPSGSTVTTSRDTWVALPNLDGTKLYVTNNIDNIASLKVFTLSPPATPLTSTTINVGRLPTTAALNGDGSRLYVLNNSGDAPGNSISVVNTADDTVVATITGLSRPFGAVRTESRLYVTNSTGGTVSMVNMATDTIDAVIAVGTTPQDPGITPDGRRVYVPNRTSGTVSVINTDLAGGGTYNTVVATLPLEGSGDVFTAAAVVALSPDGKRGFVSLNSLNQVKVIDTDPASPTYHRVLQTLTTGSAPRGLITRAVSGGLRLFVADSGGTTVSVFSTAI